MNKPSKEQLEKIMSKLPAAHDYPRDYIKIDYLNRDNLPKVQDGQELTTDIARYVAVLTFTKVPVTIGLTETYKWALV